MDWIHCNTCFAQPGSNSNSSPFFLTNCGHIYCDRCNSSVSTSNVCRVCNAQCITTTQLSTQIREEVRDYFMADTLAMLQKFIKIEQYQKDHRDKFMAHLRRAQTKYEAAKREIIRLHEELKQLRKKMHVLQQELAWYKMQMERARSRAAANQTGMRDMRVPTRVPDSPFGNPADTQRSALQHMQGSGQGNSRLTMGFTSGSPCSSRDSAISPFSLGPPSSPIQQRLPSRSAYRTNQTFLSSTPDSLQSGMRSFGNTPSTGTPDIINVDQRRPQSMRQPPSPPSRGTPTEALKILSLAYKNGKG